MAIESRVQYALDNFLNPKFFDSKKDTYELLETDDMGKTKLTLHVGTMDNICIKNYDRNIVWNFLREEKNFHMRKSIDHFILKKNLSNIWELHMFEIKKTIQLSSWRDVKNQMRTSYFTIKALATFLGIEIFNENIFTYTAYANDEKLSCAKFVENSTTKTFQTGHPLIDHKKDEWDANAIYIPLITPDGEEEFTKFKHTKIKLHSDDGLLKNNFELPN